jgi:putative AlgH/UPF0301 family transcriptional regulator
MGALALESSYGPCSRTAHLDAAADRPEFCADGGVAVRARACWILTAQKPEVEHKDLGGGLYLAASPTLLRETLESTSLPRRTMILAGYAGWSAGQLDAELEDSAWLIAPLELDLIFEIPPAASWEMAIRRLGADPALLQMGHGVH